MVVVSTITRSLIVLVSSLDYLPDGSVLHKLLGGFFGKVASKQLFISAGALVLFRGRDCVHRDTLNEGARALMLAVVAYKLEWA